MLLQIHDELVFECPLDHAKPFQNYVVDRMESAMDLDVPLAVESAISPTWFEGK
jgi:DNA polymerase-1